MKIDLEVYARTAVKMVLTLKVACHACVFVPGLGYGKALNQSALVVTQVFECYLNAINNTHDTVNFKQHFIGKAI